MSEMIKKIIHYIWRGFGIFMLLFFPIVIALDLIFSKRATSIKTTFRKSKKEIWVAWKEFYWDYELD